MSEPMYVRLPSDVKTRIMKYAKDNAKTMTGAATELLVKGLEAAGSREVGAVADDVAAINSATRLRRIWIQSLIGLSNSCHGGNCSLVEIREQGDTSRLVFVFHQMLTASNDKGEWSEHGLLEVDVRLPADSVRRR